ncbi:outer membrane lipoprotein-sorting protein [Elioraea thermophila]|uniref:outer membrane lipoprotein-sorting protein n=1 Tax=Elioraea thermophila TaxID=2185104 RepID=UPI000DF172B1|nr:outer membrane lipoprotein-sorting protein [Elioraea thermophila]
MTERNLSRRALLAGPAFLALAPAGGLSASEEAQALLREVDRNLEPASYEMYRKIINIEPSGARKEFVLYSAKKGRDRVVAVFLSPASEKGRSTLRVGENMWLYIPEVGRPVRITSLQSVIGGVFNNSDILRVDYDEEYRAERMERDGAEILLHLKAKTDQVAYDRLKMWVDPARKLPTRIDCHAADGLLVKTLKFSQVKSFGGGITRPAQIDTESPLFRGHRSVMLFDGIRARDLPDEAFTLAFLPRVESLRGGA